MLLQLLLESELRRLVHVGSPPVVVLHTAK